MTYRVGKIRDYKKDFDYLIKNKRDFIVKKSRYSRTIKITDEEKPKTSFYSKNKISPKVFHLRKKLEKQLQPNINEINKIMSKKDFDFNLLNSNVGSFCCKSITNIDLNSAYLTVLHRDGLIDFDLYNDIYNLPKKERLVSIGLLAYEPDCFEFVDGEPFGDPVPQKNDFRNFFFYCVKEVSDVMRDCASVSGEDFIFSWVDGIYLSVEKESFVSSICCDLIKEKGFNFSFEECRNFILDKKEDYCDISLYSESGERKKMTIRDDYQKKKIQESRLLATYLSNKSTENLKKYLDYKE